MPDLVGNFNIRFSPRQKEFCRLLVQAYLVKEIADLMGITFNTARSMMKTIHQITGVGGHSALLLFLDKHPHLFM